MAKVDELIARYPALSVCREDLRAAVAAICESYAGGHKLIACGNGGSASDAEHIVGELMKGFCCRAGSVLIWNRRCAKSVRKRPTIS